MNIEELKKCLNKIKQRKIPKLYNTKKWKVFNKIGRRFEGDIWNGGGYKWKIECFSQIIKDMQPSIIFETGFNVGTSACMFLNQSKILVNNPVSVFSNDINTRSIKSVNLLKKEFSNFEFILGDSSIILPQYLKENKLKIDFAFVDGDHSYNGAYNDCKNFQPYIKKGGVIFVDDWWHDPIKKGTLDVKWDGWEKCEVPKYERGARIFLKI